MSNKVYQLVTDRMVELLEAGTIPWRKTWKASEMPRSLSTGKPYQGVNVFMLWGTAMVKGYGSEYWGTYKAIQDRGGQVRKGEKSTLVVFWKFIEVEDKKTGEEKKIPMLRYFSVFNADQCDGLELPVTGNDAAADPIAAAEALFEGMPQRPEVKFGGNRAYYSPGLDYVGLPLRTSFESAESFYTTAFHELVHATGHESRLDRNLNGSFGNHEYSKEELVAEMGAAFLCALSGIERKTEDNSAAYLAHWIKALQGDPKLIVTAAGAAQKAADFISRNGANAPSGNPTEEESHDQRRDYLRRRGFLRPRAFTGERSSRKSHSPGRQPGSTALSLRTEHAHP